MRDIELYRALLGLTAPWTVPEVDLDISIAVGSTQRASHDEVDVLEPPGIRSDRAFESNPLPFPGPRPPARLRHPAFGVIIVGPAGPVVTAVAFL